MGEITFEAAVEAVIEADTRYRPGAYGFVREALHVAAQKFRGGGDDQHVSGQELLEGFKAHALAEFGPMALVVLNEWGLRNGRDVGNIVYNLIETGYFGRNEGDCIEDFEGGYDFEEAFTLPFGPMSKAAGERSRK